MSYKKCALWIGITLCVLAMLSTWWVPPFFRLFGYYVTTDEMQLAEELYAEHKSADECMHLIHFDILTPPVWEKRIGCIIHYAKIAQDPTICKGLMPSRFGLDCVGGAIPDRQCVLVDNEVIWSKGESFSSVSLSECSSSQKKSAMAYACCQIMRIALVKSENNCDFPEKDGNLFDECLFRLAFKNHNSEDCLRITDKRIKEACIIDVEALKQDPSICSGCAKARDRL